MISQFLLFCNREFYWLKLFVISDIYVLYDSDNCNSNFDCE